MQLPKHLKIAAGCGGAALFGVLFGWAMFPAILKGQLKKTSVEYLTFAAVSKLIAAGATYPYQVVRACLQDQHRTYDGTWHFVTETWRYERLRGFYKGLTPYLPNVTPNICLVMLIWEKFTNNE